MGEGDKAMMEMDKVVTRGIFHQSTHNGDPWFLSTNVVLPFSKGSG